MLSFNFTGAQTDCTNRFSGRVLDAESGERLAYAGIFLMETKKGVQADSTGFFQIDSLCPGHYTFRITHIGCLPVKVPVTITGSSEQNFYLNHKDYVLNEFVVEESADQSTELTPLSLKQAELELHTGMQLAEQVSLIPGVEMLKTGSNIAKPVFHGLYSNRLIIMNNGVRQESQYWGSEHAPEIDAYAISSYKFLEGADALMYASDAIGGVLMAAPPDIFISDKLNGSVNSSLSSNGRGGSIAGSISGRLSEKLPIYFRFQGSMKKLGWIHTSENILRNTGTEELNYSYGLGWKNKRLSIDLYYSKFNQKIGLYRYSHLGNLSDLVEVLEGRPQPDTLDFSYELQRPYQDIDHELVRTKIGYRIDERSSFNATLSRQFNARYEYDVHSGFSTLGPEDKTPQQYYALTTYLGNAGWNMKTAKNHLKVGVNSIFRTNNFRGRGFMPNYKNQNLGIYLVNTQDLGLWKLKYGARFDKYFAEVYSPVASKEDPLNFSFQGIAAAVMAQRKLEHGDLTYSFTTLWRPPAINEQFSQGLHHGVAAIEQGNPELNPERSYSGSVTFRKVYNRNKFFASAYVNYINNYIYARATDIELTIRGAFPRFDFSQTDALYWGTDLLYTASVSDEIETTLKASLVWAQNLNNGTNFINIPAHKFQGSIKYKFKDGKRLKRPFIGSSLVYTMRQYRAPSVFPYESLNSDDIPLPVSFDFAPAPDGYFLLGLNAGCSLGAFAFSLQVDNILNAAYRDYMNRFRYYADEPGINITLRANYKF